MLFYLDRIDSLARPAKLAWPVEVLGPERILFSTDYPCRFTPDGGARRFLRDANLTDATRTPSPTVIGSAWLRTSDAANWDPIGVPVHRSSRFFASSYLGRRTTRAFARTAGLTGTWVAWPRWRRVGKAG